MIQFQGTDGQPLADVKFVVERADEPMPEIAYVTGPDGKAQIGLPQGDVVIRVFLRDGKSELTRLRIGEQHGHKYIVRLPAAQQP